MPSKTFYNLSQEKQQKIIDSSKKEFSNNLKWFFISVKSSNLTASLFLGINEFASNISSVSFSVNLPPSILFELYAKLTCEKWYIFLLSFIIEK